MRKFLLASVATLGTGGLVGAALAQTPPGAPVPTPLSAPAPISGPIGAPTQGQQAWPMAPSPMAYVNNNNNYQAPMLPGAVANPTPGTIVVHVNAKVQVVAGGTWTSADTRAFTAPNGAPGAPPITSIGSGPLALGSATSASAAQNAILGVNGTGTAKLQPQVIGSYGRLYFGGDGMATNGLRYGAAIEVRENFSGEPSGASASTYSSLETMYVRRAFTYVAGDNWGIVRAGQADGLIGIFDNGVTTMQFLPTGNFNGGDTQSLMPTAVPPTWIWLSGAGGEYDNTKVVYMSPQIAGGADLCRVHGGWQHYWRGTMASCHSSRRWCSDAGLPAGRKLRERAVDGGNHAVEHRCSACSRRRPPCGEALQRQWGSKWL